MCHFTMGNFTHSKTYANLSAALINQSLQMDIRRYLYQLMSNNR